jgi:uncharacterized membrane protein
MAATIAVTVVAILHLVFLVLEMFWRCSCGQNRSDGKYLD